MPTKPRLFAYAVDNDGVGRMVWWLPIECKVCQALHSFMVNRGGRTTCMWCDSNPFILGEPTTSKTETTEERLIKQHKKRTSWQGAAKRSKKQHEEKLARKRHRRGKLNPYSLHGKPSGGKSE